MINAIMPWRLLFLAAASVLVTASLPQPNGGVRLASTCVTLNKSEEVVGITSLKDIVAVASRFQVTIHSIAPTRQTCKKTDEITFPAAIDKFTEFKLLNETAIFYCDTTHCNYCLFGSVHLCRALDIRKDQKDLEISSAAATQTTDGRKILLRIVFSTQKSYLMVFEDPLLGETSITSSAWGVDVAFLQRHYVATGFNVDGFSYFVTSSYQPYEPETVKKRQSGDDPKHFYRVKIMRVCDGDGTDKLESRIEISLACPGIDELNNRGVATATYSPSAKKIFVVFSTNSSNDVVCSYSIDEVNKKVERTWKVCQNTTFSDASQCGYEANEYREYCLIFTRMADHSRSLGCSRYSSNHDIPEFNMCRLHEYAPTAYRFGWLESYIDLDGTPVAIIDNRGHKYNRVFTDEAYSSLFFTGDDRMARVPVQFGGNKKSKQLETTASLVKFYKPTSRFALAHVTPSSFLLIDHLSVNEHDLSCQSLYPDCTSLAKGGFNDPLKCVFCFLPDTESGGYVMEQNEKSSCQMPLTRTCPPVVREAKQNPDRKEEWLVHGDSLNTFNNPHVKVCDQHCHIDIETAGEKSLTCTLQSSSVLDPTCHVKYEGQIENYQKFSVSPVKSTKDSSTQTGTSPVTSNAASGSTMSRTWKIVIGVVAIILIIAIIIIIILGARKYLGMRNQKGNGSMGVPFENMTNSHYPRTAARNTYLSTDPSGMPFAHQMSPAHAPAYERLFREIDDRLKIPSDHLLLEKQIGKGHFGIVLKGTYNPPDGQQRPVACKTLTGHVTGGISEFVNEGLMMDRFDHPRVMTLVGISFNEERMPIIVTDYMENGDLAKYLRDVKNKPTLRDLLNFTHEIAQGMQYLHENKFIHRDLAARNCMLDKDLHVKVADFGLCRVATEQDEYLPIHSGREMPLRWMAPEALEREQFTMAGDVWAFGVVIWEVMTRGMNPYPNLQQAYVLFEFLKAGKRMGKPDFCPDILFRVMLDCWHGEPTLRPTFKELPDQIEEIIDVLSSNHRIQMNAEYEQCNSVRNSRAASSSATTPITHHAISHVHSLPMESPDPTPV